MSECAVERPTLFTIGHSDLDATEFIAALTHHGIDTIADVRSQPYSRFHPQFNREPLAESLKLAGLRYVFLGRELGARRVERESYEDSQARYDLISRLPAYREGLDRIRRGVANCKIALMCAEKDPITCHRTILIGRDLRQDVEIRHIVEEGQIETSDQAESRLLELVGLPAADLFRTRLELIEEAYDLQAKRIAFKESEAALVAAQGIA